MPITNADEYDAVVKEMEILLDMYVGEKDVIMIASLLKRIDELSDVVSAYDKIHYQLGE